MNVAELLARPHAWMAGGESDPVVVSSRVRLARNLEEAAFPDWAGEEERVRVWERLRAALVPLPVLDGPVTAANEELSDLERALLFERHLVSREHAARGRGSGVMLRADESVAVMVNEEDHLRMQALGPGLDLQRTWQRINEVDDQVEGVVPYAFSPRLGYLTACPSNVGTGLRASAMLHLPGLVLMDDMEAVVRGVHKIGLAVRGLWGEGTEAHGNLFQISNQMTLGEKEEEIVRNLEQVVLEIAEHERNARLRLLEQRETLLRDQVGRAVGILSRAHILSSKEALDLLSALRLGIEMGIVKGLDRGAVDELLVMVQPAHVQRAEGKELKPHERDRARAVVVRGRLAEAMKRRRGRKKKDE